MSDVVDLRTIAAGIREPFKPQDIVREIFIVPRGVRPEAKQCGDR